MTVLTEITGAAVAFGGRRGVAQQLRSLALGALLFVPGSPAHALHISDLLNNMRAAERQLNYQGVFVLRKQDRLLSMRVSHAAGDNGARETLETLNGEARRVLRDNRQVLSVYPQRKLVVISADSAPREHSRLPEDLGALQAYYEIERLPDDRIADQPTAVLQLTPRDNHRYGYRYWVDANTGVLLRCDLTTENDSVIEQMMFTQVQYVDTLPDSLFSLPDTEGYQRRHLGDDRIEIDNVAWRVNALPPGFVLTQSSEQRQDGRRNLHLVYSDGLASVSVFIEGDDGDHALSGPRHMGALNAYGLRHGKYSITVMGEVPAATVEQIALSTEYLGEAGSDDHDDDAEPEIGD